ncbi:MAG: GTPase Era [Actinomycetota bacterium]|nr:GTPase Era [Actinomycetota bacterium]MDP2289492.1 GTPase Era [Actinomycetota bacterium]
MAFRSGFVSIVGRPNAGKSTLTNRLVGQKIAITSSRPQTTRRLIRGILTSEDAQLILVDTPGLHRPRTLLGERLNDQVRETWTTVDAIGLCLPADQLIGPGDRYIAKEIVDLGRIPIIVIITKSDKVSREDLAARLLDAQLLAEQLGTQWATIVPVSSNNGENIDALVAEFITLMPEGPLLYVDGEVTDEPLEIAVAELIREAALEGVVDELPHSIAVTIEEMGLRPGRSADRPLTDIHANLFVERDSQKSIIIGKGGSRLKAVGTKARHNIEHLVGTPVYLDIRVKIAKDWQRDPKQLRRLGF